MTAAAAKKHPGAYSIVISLIVAIGGFLLGFDSSVISGATPFYKRVFELPEGSLLIGLSVSSIIAGAVIGNLFAGLLADRFGRKKVLLVTALLFGFCAVGCALATSVAFFIVARIVGGLGIGLAILIAPMYIAEIAPPAKRGFLVTFNQLNIVTGISVAYFSNYFVLRSCRTRPSNWRVMLGVGTIPALLYLLLLLIVPESPRWLVQRGRDEQALAIMRRVGGEEHAAGEYQQIKKSLATHAAGEGAAFGELFSKRMRFVMFIGLVIAFFQQVSGINAILYYAPMIFEMAGGGKEAAFLQAVILGLVNFGMTIVSMFLIDRLGRKPLLLIGSLLMAASLLTASFAFRQARYELTERRDRQGRARRSSRRRATRAPSPGPRPTPRPCRRCCRRSPTRPSRRRRPSSAGSRRRRRRPCARRSTASSRAGRPRPTWRPRPRRSGAGDHRDALLGLQGPHPAQQHHRRTPAWC